MMIDNKYRKQNREISKLKMIISGAIPPDIDIASIIIALNSISADFARILIEQDKEEDELGGPQ